MTETELTDLCESVLDGNPDKVNNYHLGKTGLIGMFMGEVMKRSNGEADPKKTHDILLKKLSNSSKTSTTV